MSYVEPRTHTPRPTLLREEVSKEAAELWLAIRDICVNGEAWWILHNALAEAFERGRIAERWQGFDAKDRMVLEAGCVKHPTPLETEV